MKKPLRVIVIEDSEDDAILVVRAMRSFGYEVSFEGVDTSGGLQEAFERGPWDLIISDYSLPKFSVPEALKLLEESGLDLPFIIVSGKIGEETAVKMMKLGAHDYLLKDNLSRLDLSIERELRDAKTRKDHRLTEAALRQSEERFRQLAENIEEVFWMTNPQRSQTIYISPSYAKIWGRTCESLYRNPISFLENIHPEDAPRILASLKKLATGGYEEVYRIIKADGTIRWIRDRAFPIKNEDGEVYRIAGIAEDITGHKLAEKSLAAEKERWFVTLKSIGDGVITTDTEGRVALMNPVAENLTGWNQLEAAGKPLQEVFNIIDETKRQPLENPVARVIASGGIAGLPSHSLLISRDGIERSIADSGAPIRDNEGNILGVVLVSRDVTEQRKIQEERLKTMKLESISLLAGGIAHDFNNILAGILGSISMAEYDLPSDNKGKEWLTKAKKAVLRAKDLTQQLLTFSKGGAPVKELFSLRGLLKESASFALSGSNIRCQFLIPDDLLNVEADRGQINQVIHNIVLNAQQAMPDGGVIKIGAENVTIGPDEGRPVQEGKFVKIFIEDHGRGISENDLPRIFDPYFTTKAKGSGLGLASAHSIVKRHGGHTSVISKVGSGTTFEIYLPASEKDIAVRAEESDELVTGSGKVLVMDDEEIVREIIGAILGEAGYQVEYARDGRDAIDLYREAEVSGRSFDLVVVDLTIPGGMGGKETIKELRALYPDVKAIVSSGYSNDPIMADWKKYGFKGVVVKPYSMREFTKTVKAVLVK